MSKNFKRTRYAHYDKLPTKEAIKQLNDDISSMKNRGAHITMNSYYLDLIAQRDYLKGKLNGSK